MTVHAWAAKASGGALEPFSYEERELGPEDVEVTITHCGICRSDVHMVDNDWGRASYPLVPGHEIVGLISAKGDRVQGLELGQRVGIGWQRSACLYCDQCVNSDDNLCAQRGETIVKNHGGFADRIRTDSRFAFPIPDGLTSRDAAPLLCAGATVYSPLQIYDVRPPMRVAVVGIGGLGHLAVQFLAAWGCEVVAISSSASKEQEARELGASEFLHATPDNLRKWSNSFDFMMSTSPSSLDAEAFLNLLRPKGKLCILGLLEKPLVVPAYSLIGSRRMVGGSAIANRARMREMLRFAARHNIVARTETMPLQEVNVALERLRAGKVRYRMVLEV